MKYHSTRGNGGTKSFEEVLVSTYASDGGMWVPVQLPQIKPGTLYSWSQLEFADVCAEIMHLFTDLEVSLLKEMTKDALNSFNNGDEPLPMRRYKDLILLDCSLGPTFAFKDVGLQVVSRLLNHVLGAQKRKANVVIDTSGDTGPAAIAGVKGCPHVEIFCLYPHGRVSDVQELQMVTVQDLNVHVYRTEGTSDEQASVLKSLFTDISFCKDNNLCSVNSINWFRIAVQSTYFVWAYLQIYGSEKCFGLPVNFCIPTGAFGNALSCYVAKAMGVPIGKIICSTNSNDIVHRTISKGDISMGQNIETLSPAMDIQFAYNLERLLYYTSDNTHTVEQIMRAVDDQFNFKPNATGVQLDAKTVERISESFLSVSVSDEETLKTMKEFKDEFDIVLCPHSAIGVYAGLHPFASLAADQPFVCVLTAHPAKFEVAVRRATGEPPVFPGTLLALKNLPHRFKWLRKSVHADTDTEVEEEVEKQLEGEAKIEDDGEMKELTARWRGSWIKILKHDILNPRSSS